MNKLIEVNKSSFPVMVKFIYQKFNIINLRAVGKWNINKKTKVFWR